jgi:sodium transport system permease protein
LFILVGGAVVATDSLAGEKERGTLETLLTTAASRIDIITAKHLAILAVALVITGIETGSFLVYVGFKLIPAPPGFFAAVPPTVAVLLFMLFLPMAALASSVLLLTSGCAKSHKEAEFYFLPVLLLGLMPAMAPFLPGLALRSAIVLVPVANIALATKEILTGAFDWPMIIIAWLVTAASAWWVTRLCIRLLSAEKLITSVETDAVEFAGGPALFERHVLRWFALLWGAWVIINNYAATADLRVKVPIILVGLFFGSSLVMIWRYQLSPRTALALRAPKPIVWLAILLAIPSGLLTEVGLSRLTNFIIPIPQHMIEGLDELLIPKHIPMAQLLLFLAVMPGIFEEIAMRGLLLHGLRRRLHPAALALVVGLVFGFFHFDLFRLMPTSCLGVLLAAVTLLTGSIFPAMFWHASNNAIALLSAKQQTILAELNPICYLSGVGILALAFWVIWRNRTPYPGLRPWSIKR